VTATRRPRGEEGATLVVALLVLTSFALVMASLLSLGGSSLVATSALRSQRSQIYATEAALDEAMTRLRSNQSCDGPAPPPYSLPKANTVSVTVTCTSPTPDGPGQTFLLSAFIGNQLQAKIAFDLTTAKIQRWDGNHEYTPPSGD
jgi:hypothetical protein